MRLMTPKIMRAGIADVFSMFRTQGVDLNDRLGRLPQLEFPAQYESNADAP
jgi:hypothetical protein